VGVLIERVEEAETSPQGAISGPPGLIPGVGQGFRRRNRLWRSTGFPGPPDFSGARSTHRL